MGYNRQQMRQQKNAGATHPQRSLTYWITEITDGECQ